MMLPTIAAFCTFGSPLFGVTSAMVGSFCLILLVCAFDTTLSCWVLAYGAMMPPFTKS